MHFVVVICSKSCLKLSFVVSLCNLVCSILFGKGERTVWTTLGNIFKTVQCCSAISAFAMTEERQSRWVEGKVSFPSIVHTVRSDRRKLLYSETVYDDFYKNYPYST